MDWTTRYADYQTVLQQTLGSQASRVQVMATEYNSVYNDPGKQSTSLVNGLFVAESLGGLLDSGYSGSFVWDLRNSYDTSQNNSNLLYGWREGGEYGQLGDPNTNSPPATGPYVAYSGYYALQLASKIITAGGEVVSATSNYSDLDVYAVKESSGDLDLLVINVNPAAALTEQFELTGFQPTGAAQVWQYGETQDTAQGRSRTGASALASASTIVRLSGSDFSYAFPAYSMTVLDLTPNTGPTVTGVSSTKATGTYGAGTAIPIAIAFSGPVKVRGTPQLQLDDGGVAKYSGGSGTSTLTFTYVVAAKQNTADLDYASTAALMLDGGSIKDLAGIAASLTLPPTGTDGLATQNIVIDTTAPAAVTPQASGDVAALTGGPNALYTDLAIALLFGNNDAENVLGSCKVI